MSNTSRIYASGAYRTPILYNSICKNLEHPVIWGGDQKRSYFPDGYDAVYKVKGNNCTDSKICGDSRVYCYVTAGNIGGIAGMMTSPQYYSPIWLKESSATKWTTPTKFAVNECQSIMDDGKQGVGVTISAPRGLSYSYISSPKLNDVRTYTGPTYKFVNGKQEVNVPGHYNFHSPGITYIGKYGHITSCRVYWGNLNSMPWGFIPAFDGCGMGFPSSPGVNSREITVRFDTLFGIPVADTKFHFVAFYKSGQKSDFYDDYIPKSGYQNKHIKYLYQGANITHDTIKNSQSTNSGIKFIAVKGSEKIYHFWSSFTAKKGTHGFMTPIGIGFSGNSSKNTTRTFYDNATSFRVRP